MAAPKAPASAAGSKPTQLTQEEFREWTHKCRVRKIQKKHLELVLEAQSEGVDFEQHVRQKGYRDFKEFTYKHYKECPKFGLTCRTSELGELGVGFVLYFRLVRYLALVLFLLGLLQIPVMVTYSGSDLVSRWLYYSDWTRGYDMDTSDACACLGDNRRVQGPSAAFQDPQYGTSCEAWDVDACFAAAGPFSNPGKWCCRSWCFADPLCKESDQASSPSLSARWYRGMVRVSTGCPQNATLLAQRCAGLPDVAFSEDSRPVVGSAFIGMWWLSPGSLGPDEANQTHILAMYIICVLFLSGSIVTHRQFQVGTIEEVDAQLVTPSDFAIMVKGLPRTMTDETTIADFFRKNAVNGQESTEVVKVVIGWDHTAYSEKMKELTKARKSLRLAQDGQQSSGCCGGGGVAEDEVALKQQIQDIKKGLYQDDDSDKLLSSGTVVVVFRWQADMRKCLSKWNGFWQRWSYAQRAGAGMWPGEALPTFGEEGAQLQVERAANPGDIHWEELGHSQLEKSRLWVLTSFAMLVLIAVGFVLSWLLNTWQTDLKQASAGSTSMSSRLLSILPATVISLINFLLRVAGRIFGEKEYQDTWGQQEFSQGFKMFWSMLINTACVILFINAQPKDWYTKGGLVDDVFYMLVIDSIVARLCLFCDITYTFNYIFRRNLTPEKVEAMNRTIKENNVPRKTPEQEEALDSLRAEVDSFKEAFEPEEIDNPDRYARVLVTFLCCVFFAPVFPASVFIGMAGLLLQYVLDKVLLLKWYKRPRPQNEVQAMWCLQMLKFLAPLALSAGVLIFLMPSWSVKRQVLSFSLVSIVLSLVTAVFPSRVLAWCNVFSLILACCRKSGGGETSAWDDYYHAQFMWQKDFYYHMDQPLYKQVHRANPDHNPRILKPGREHRTSPVDISSVRSRQIKAAETETHYRRKAPAGRPPRGRSDLALVSKEPSLDVEEGRSARPTYSGVPPEPLGRPADGISPESVGPIAMEVPVRWQYEAGGSYKDYANDCQRHIESRYQVFLKDSSRSQAIAKTGTTTLLIDFSKMTQKVKDSHGKERSIKRVTVEQ